MEYGRLGNSGLTVSRIGMGCWALAGDATWGPQEETESIETIHAALDAGVSYFDTAEGYGGGASETVLGRALAGRRQQAVIATKVGRAHQSAGALRRACEQSLKRLGTDYVDLYQLHWPSWTVPLEETVEALARLLQEGKVRAIGVCNFGVRDLADLLAIGWADANQLPYSLLWRAIEHEIKPACVDRGIAILCYAPLFQGLLAGKFATPDEVPEGRARTRLFSHRRPQTRHGEAGWETETFRAIAKIREICGEIGQTMANVALAWLLHQTGVTSVIVGARRPDQIRQTARATGLALSPETIDRLTETTEEVKTAIGSNPDMWQSPGRFR